MKSLSSAFVMLALATSTLLSAPIQTPATPAPRADVNPAGQAMADFADRVRKYIELRKKADDTVPAPQTSADAAKIRASQVALATRLKTARATARQGDIFTPAVSAHLTRVLRPETSDKGTKDAIKDDNPGAIPLKVNDPYPEKAPLSSMPVNVLKALPKLPENEDIDYRFIGTHLILLDTRANMIIDYLPNAIP